MDLIQLTDGCTTVPDWTDAESLCCNAMPTDEAIDYETVKKKGFDTIRYHERKLSTSIPNCKTKNG